jgi:hypothetical protein
VTGFPPGVVVGTIHSANAVALQAKADVVTAYNSLAGQTCTGNLTGQDLGGRVLTQGVYCFSSSAGLTGTLTLDAQGNAGAVFIFQIGSTLITASNSSVALANGAQACNVFWQVGSSATLGTGTTLVGNILALESISLTTAANVNGRALARNAAVTLDTNRVTRSTCAGAPGPPPTGPCPTLTLSPSSLPNGAVGVPASVQFTATGGSGPYTFSVVGGRLPAGVTLTPGGLLSGTPTTAETANFTIRVTNPNGCSLDQPYTVIIAVAVPTLPQWGMIALAFFLALAGLLSLRARRTL